VGRGRVRLAGETDRVDRGRETLLRVLHDGDVRFVVIGGAALQSHGQRYETEDIDITPDRAQQNLRRLADVLNRLECRLAAGDRRQDRQLRAIVDRRVETIKETDVLPAEIDVDEPSQ
jgi:hypothetical protein